MMPKLLFLLLTFSSFILHPASFAVAASCPEGPIISSCQCGAQIRNSGFCCDGDNGDNGVYFRGDYYDQCPSTTNNYRYVKNDGNDASDGKTLATAWRTMHKLSQNIQAGQTGIVLGGTYNEQNGTMCGPYLAGTLDPVNDGTSTNPITIKGHPDFERPVVKASGFNTPQSGNFGDGHYLHRAVCIGSWTTLDYLEVTDSYAGVVFGGGNIILQDLKIHNTYGSNGENPGGMWSTYGFSWDVIIRGNEIYRIFIEESEGYDPGGGWKPFMGGSNDAAMIFYKHSNFTVEDNYMHDVNIGVSIKGGVRLPRTTVRRNKFVNVNSQAIRQNCEWSHADEYTPGVDAGLTDIYENAFYNAGGVAILLHNDVMASCGTNMPSGYGILKDVKIFNNSVHTSRSGLVLKSSQSQEIKNTFSYNNIFFNQAIVGIAGENMSVFWDTLVPGLNTGHNLYFDPTENDVLFWCHSYSGEMAECVNPPDAHYTLSEFKTSVRPDLEMNSVQQDPQFLSTDPASPDFLKPATGSPAIDAGTIVSGYHCPVSGDIDPTQTGCKLWYGSAPDIGAFEYNPGLPKDKLPPAKPKGLMLK
ncbi:MAG: hypothetical protein HY400_02640 [Elusimicrobia bacterium]|nr:hypothetical protein [Elusimicrobiota bacterium]